MSDACKGVGKGRAWFRETRPLAPPGGRWKIHIWAEANGDPLAEAVGARRDPGGERLLAWALNGCWAGRGKDSRAGRKRLPGRSETAPWGPGQI